MIRRTPIFSGHVQGVGFRYTAQSVAGGFAITGYVRNLPDGRVELLAEGEPEEIDRFLQRLTEQLGQFINRRTDNDDPAVGDFKDFTVRH